MKLKQRTGQREIMTERAARVFELRKAGLSHRQIAETLARQGIRVSDVTVGNDIKRVLAKLTREIMADAAELRALEMARLDELQARLWPKALQGELRAIEAYLRIAARRAAMLGLDAPQRAEVGLTLPAELQTKLQQAGVKASDVFAAMLQVLAEVSSDAQPADAGA